jgi:hypothetical protein
MKPIDDAIITAYKRFCKKSCPIMWSMDYVNDEDQADKINSEHCDNCIIEIFIKNELKIDMK